MKSSSKFLPRALLAFLVFCAASNLGCARSKRSSNTTSATSDSATAFGPRADLVPSADPSSMPSALPVVDGARLLDKIRQSGHKGVVVNVWASWCDPCREELPMLARVAPKLSALGVPIWLVSVDDPDGYSAAKGVLESLHVELPSFAAAPPLQAFKLAMNPKWPGMIPVSFLFDTTGKLRYFWAGEVYEKELVPIVEGFAAGKHIDGVSDFGLAPGATHGANH